MSGACDCRRVGGVGHFDDEDAAGTGGDAMGMAGALADYPEYVVVGIDEEQLGLFVRMAEFVVGEVVAEQLGSVNHAEGLETVARLPMAQTQWQDDGVGIEGGLVGWQQFGIEAFGWDGDGEKSEGGVVEMGLEDGIGGLDDEVAAFEVVDVGG